MKKQKILVTSALLYSNGELHLGHLVGAYLPADCYVRAMRLLGHNVHFISGSDEYGVAITMSAEQVGNTPKEHVDHFHAFNKALFNELEIDFDHYSRTTWSGHAAVVQEFFLNLLKKGLVEKREVERLYSEEDQKFLADRYVMGTCPKCGYEKARGDECTSCGASFEAEDLKNPRSKMTQAPLVLKKTTDWFLLLDQMRDPLFQWFQQKQWKPNVSQFVLNYIEDLQPRSITRDMKWGVPVPLPEAEGKVLYVWFDAPIGYITGSMEWGQLNGTPDRWKDYWQDSETKLVHFIGKDNIPFHSAIFPAMCLGQDKPWITVSDLPANEFLNLEGRKLSKSEGWTIDIADFLKKFSSDQIRYALAACAPETKDSEFLLEDFKQRCNGDLVGKFGNLANRVFAFIEKRQLHPRPEDLDEEFIGRLRFVVSEIAECYQTYRLRRAAHLVMELAQMGNTYFDHNKPWKLVKEPGQEKELNKVLWHCLECLKFMSLCSYPIIPQAAEKLRSLLGYEKGLKEESWDEVVKTLYNKKPLAPELIFKKIEDEMIEEEMQKLTSCQNEKKEMQKLTSCQNEKMKSDYIPEPLKGEITFDQLDPIDLRVGCIIEAVRVPKSSKLLKLQVDIGAQANRQVVAGIGKCYKPEELVGKKVIVVANLKPAKLMGVESQGMVLAAGDGKLLEVPKLENVPPGSTVC